MDPRCKGMPLSSFLLKPMQRVTRYPLIIKNVRSFAKMMFLMLLCLQLNYRIVSLFVLSFVPLRYLIYYGKWGALLYLITLRANAETHLASKK